MIVRISGDVVRLSIDGERDKCARCGHRGKVYHYGSCTNDRLMSVKWSPGYCGSKCYREALKG